MRNRFLLLPILFPPYGPRVMRLVHLLKRVLQYVRHALGAAYRSFWQLKRDILHGHRSPPAKRPIMEKALMPRSITT